MNPIFIENEFSALPMIKKKKRIQILNPLKSITLSNSLSNLFKCIFE